MIEEYVGNLQKFLKNRHPETLLILGSGLGRLADDILDKQVVSYQDLGFPASTVSGHAGNLIIGRLGSKEVACMQGRFHLYEGYKPELIKEVIAAFAAVGIKELIVTNAAGSLRADMPTGSLMLIKDHINLSGKNPLIGPNDERFGPRFPDMSNAYDKVLSSRLLNIAAEQGIKIYEGTYLMVLGPTFETPAEVRAFGILGADAVGMSTVPEVIAAVYVGMKVLGVSVITNLGTGLQQKTQSHAETLAQADGAAVKLARLLKMYMEEK